MTEANNFLPGNPVNVPVRPLDKGIIRNLMTEGIPSGGFLDLKDFQVSTRGLQRRGDWRLDGRFSSFAVNPPMRDIWRYWDTDGKHVSLAVDNTDVFEFNT